MSFDNLGVSNFDVKDQHSLANRWEKWLRGFEYLVVGRDITKCEQKKALLLHLAGPDVQDIFETLAVPQPREGEEVNAYNQAVEMLSAYFRPKKNTTYERHLFRAITQEHNESFDQFLTKLKQQAKLCDFQAQEETNIKDQIVDKCINPSNLRRKILEKGDDFPLADIINLAKSMEITAVQNKVYENKAVLQVNKVQQKTRQETYEQKNPSKKIMKCFRCGKVDHLSKDSQCPARKSTCKKCGHSGHWAKYCKTKNTTFMNHKAKVNQVNQGKDEDYAFTVQNCKLLTVECSVGGVDLPLIVDSGASINIIDNPTWNDLKSKGIKCISTKANECLYAYGQTKPLTVCGKFQTVVSKGEKNIKAEFLVFEGKGKPLLGYKTCQELGILSFSVNNVSVEQHQTIKGVKVTIPIEKHAELPFCRARPIPYGLKDQVKERLVKMEKEGIISKVESAKNASAMVVVPKASGGIRLCGDYKQTINKHVLQVPTQQLNITDLLQNLGGKTWFSKIDLEGAYLQLELEEDSKSLTTINTPFGLYQYNRLPYGIKSSPGIFEANIKKILSDLPGVESYMDDILVSGKSKEEHDKNLKATMTRLKEHQVKINKEKSLFCQKKIDFLGHSVSAEGILPIQNSMEAIQNMQYPQTKKELQSWLGSIQFYSKFLKNLANDTEPLYRLMKKNVLFTMEETQKACIDSIKKKLLTPLLLKPFQPGKPITVTCDASQKGLGAVMEQDGFPVMAISKILTEAEQKYSQIEREALALVWATKRLSKFLLGTHFTLITDHKPLQYIFSPNRTINTVTAARLQRWAISLMAFDFAIKAVKSEEVPLADLLSRCGSSLHSENQKFEVNAIFTYPVPQIRKELLRIMKMDKWVKLKEYIRTGFPKNLDARLSPFVQVKHDLTVDQDLIYKGQCLVIPEELQHIILAEIHKEHWGIQRCKQYARRHFFWPKISHDIEKLISNCGPCLTYKPKSSNKPEWSSWPAARKPMERIHMDFGEYNGSPFLVVVDAFSRWPEIFVTKDMTAFTIKKCLRNFFSRFGIAQFLVSDNGPSLIAQEVENWLANIGCEHITSPVYHPKSNGLAERLVRTFKEHSKVNRPSDLTVSVDRFLFSYRNIPNSTTGLSPAMLMLGRELRSSASVLNAPCYASVPLAKTFTPGTIIGQHGKVITCETEPGQIVKRHQEQMKMPLLLEGPKDPDVPQCGSNGRMDGVLNKGESQSKGKSEILDGDKVVTEDGTGTEGSIGLGMDGGNGVHKGQLDGPSTGGQPIGQDNCQTKHHNGACSASWEKIKERGPNSPPGQQWPRRSSRRTVPVQRFMYD